MSTLEGSDNATGEIVSILRATIKEYRALLNAAAAIIIEDQEKEANQAWLAAADKYGGIVNVCDQDVIKRPKG